jgi:hypothetical protein
MSEEPLRSGPGSAGAAVEKCRQEAGSLREAAEVIRDEGLREQLLSFAQQYENLAMKIEAELRLLLQQSCEYHGLGIVKAHCGIAFVRNLTSPGKER